MRAVIGQLAHPIGGRGALIDERASSVDLHEKSAVKIWSVDLQDRSAERIINEDTTEDPS